MATSRTQGFHVLQKVLNNLAQEALNEVVAETDLPVEQLAWQARGAAELVRKFNSLVRAVQQTPDEEA
jgi:hypothetical protein